MCFGILAADAVITSACLAEQENVISMYLNACRLSHGQCVFSWLEFIYEL